MKQHRSIKTLALLLLSSHAHATAAFVSNGQLSHDISLMAPCPCTAAAAAAAAAASLQIVSRSAPYLSPHIT
jgi:hypothetical protein